METTSRPRPGGRSARVVAAVHAAALEILDEVGYEGLQLTDVARRADVNKTTVYRRWATKAALVGELLASHTQSTVGTPDTGSLRGDLEQLLADIASTLSEPAVRAIIHGALVSAPESDSFEAARTRFWDERFERSGAIVERAVERGEVPAGTNARAVLEFASSPIYFRALFTREELGPDVLAELASRTTRAFGTE